MRLRSLLFVPGDRPDRMEKALKSGADAVIVDLEDSVLPERKPWARKDVAQFLSSASREVTVMVRVNPLGSSDLAADLEAILPAKPEALVLPKSESGTSVAELAAMLGLAHIPILPIATETPKAVFGLGTYGAVASRLCGLTWGAEDLPAAIGATTARRPGGSYTPPYELVRSLTLFGAHAAGVPAIETVYTDFIDTQGLRAYAARARRDGFSGMMAIHPTQIAVINAAFAPTEAEIAHARAVIAAFAENPGAGAIKLNDKMIDRPHLLAAQRLLARL
ncbi:HpcH/HpaI aldolase/citrate lyase family protein [Pelagibacterium halotolerans]|uniref:Hydroxymethylglutaryl-CoA lyase n=1 Tax=Pelagibacterium halotolerans (strain DSM 22347 / JCM 15775 / CGMCC 1.7692 / B2) TaxID=1082931 RepID=G4R604_PELHB|nr:CoA ester lyase [Pelagibacterium halotolerans]AEQ51119.1 hydroxymethylglutaryl-CoA lyase [Pelagibacterium halotolerans B2]QJR19003.1 CoA ester lyase [Pelagibacterium halotolerans]SEA70304.1 citrate lyase subunit beta / citryl-CoA lyase [Pelagibacterium halotolerans]